MHQHSFFFNCILRNKGGKPRGRSGSEVLQGGERVYKGRLNKIRNVNISSAQEEMEKTL